jgi:drug/metabolite transporter (DMT)-like permease
MKNNHIYMLGLIVLVSIFGGSVPPFSRLALQEIPTFTLVFLRFSIATICLLPWVIKKQDFNISTLRRLGLVSVVGAMNPILLFIALNYTQSAVSPIIYGAVPMLTALYLYVFERVKITKLQLIGITIGFIGVTSIVLYPLLFSTDGLEISILGNTLIFGAAIAFTAYGIISKKIQKRKNSSPFTLIFYFSLVTAILSSILMALFEDPMFTGYSITAYGGALWVGLVGTVLFYVLYQYVIKIGDEITANLFTYLQPVATIVIGYLLLNEIITLPFVIGAVLAIVGAQIAAKK